MDILLFGVIREIVGQSKLTVPASENVNTVERLKFWLADKYPAFSKLSSFAVAIDNEYAEDNEELNSASEVALIPPVSGG